jgi:single-stranded-DNA-specific exonuclease
MGRKQWVLRDTPDSVVKDLVRTCNLPRPVALVLAARSIPPTEVDDFIKAHLRCLSDPFLIPDTLPAVTRIWEAIAAGEEILIHGDYDTDGITATVLLEWVLRHNGAKVRTFLPHRFDDGYGFTPDSLAKGLEGCQGNCRVLVTVDCGITSYDAVEKANSLGIDVIITDHHEPADRIPRAQAVINTKLHPSLKNLQVLSGVGIAFKLCHAFIKYGREQKLGGFQTNLQEGLDLVALGTIADIVPLLGENRILVKHGIAILGKQVRPGIRALFEMARIQNNVKPSDITFKLAPRLNAAGRLGYAEKALELLKTENILDAYRYAQELELYNNERQTTEEMIFQEASKQIVTNIDLENDCAILVAGDNWHQGVIGIVASRLSREYNRPAVVLTIQGAEAHGSGRGIGTMNMVEALAECSTLLNRYGGHPMAVGLGLPTEKIPEFFQKFKAIANRCLSSKELVDHIYIDGEAKMNEFDAEFFRYLDDLAPFGHSNAYPVFLLRNVETVRIFPIGQNHSRGYLRDAEGNSFEFIAFNMPPESFPSSRIDLLVTPQINEYRGERKPQLQLVDLKIC